MIENFSFKRNRLSLEELNKIIEKYMKQGASIMFRWKSSNRK
jgi:hypothetical protein